VIRKGVKVQKIIIAILEEKVLEANQQSTSSLIKTHDFKTFKICKCFGPPIDVYI
jgi:hypothetical protein